MRNPSFRLTHPNPARLVVLVTLTIGMLSAGVSYADDPVRYESGYFTIAKLAGELHAALDSRKQQTVQRDLTLLESMPSPCLGPMELQDGQVQKTVQLSAGFVVFINSLSHARALSNPAADVLKAYATRVASSAFPPLVTDGMDPEKAWNFEVMNAQAGQFNQMAGGLVAIEFAHHYLGHYKKYAAQMTADSTGVIPPIGNFLTESEWRDAVLKGAKNALDCGLGVDGLKTLFECLEAMPSRPGWCAYFAPDKANFSTLSKELKRLERDFFLAEK